MILISNRHCKVNTHIRLRVKCHAHKSEDAAFHECNVVVKTNHCDGLAMALIASRMHLVLLPLEWLLRMI